MAFLLRKLNKKARWNQQHIKDTFQWLGEHEIPSDYVIKELETENCNLSFWLIDDDKSNLSRVLAALASNRPHLSEMDFGLIDLDLVQSYDFNVEEKPGDTADEGANGWHRDISKLSAQRLVELAVLLLEHMEADRRRSEKQILDYVFSSISAYHIDLTKIALKSEKLDARLNT